MDRGGDGKSTSPRAEVIPFSIKWKVQEITLYDFMLKTEYKMN